MNAKQVLSVFRNQVSPKHETIPNMKLTCLKWTDGREGNCDN